MSQRIVLQKQNHTIKVVNRKDKVTLKRLLNNVSLHHSGRKGDKGDTGISTFVRVHHLNDPNVARPFAQFVEWVGTVAPVNGTTEDTWIDTA